MARRVLTYEICKEIAAKSKTIAELQKKDGSVYNCIRQNDWKELLNHMVSIQHPRGYWNYERCKEVALSCKTIKELTKLNGTVYNRIRQNDWKELLNHMTSSQLPSGYWNYERCKEEALKYHTRVEFQKKSPSAYGNARKNGFVDDICKHMDYLVKPKGYYTYDKFKEIVSKYTTFKDFMANDYGTYCALRIKKEWFKELTKHLEYKFKPNGYWTFEKCQELTKGYTNATKFRKENKTVANIIKKNNWDVELYKNMSFDTKQPNYWTYETLKEEALKYDNKKDFRKNSSTAAALITKNNWNELTNHMKKLSTIKERVIYVFEFEDNHVYVGLTCKPNKRYHEHVTEEKSQVFKHIQKTKANFQFKILTEKPIPMEIAGEQEAKTLQHYINNGWIILNKAKTGSLGGVKPIWTYERCKQAALKYNCPKQLRKELKHVIYVMKEKGWFEELTSHIIDNRRIKYWTYERCKQAALKYKTKSEFMYSLKGAYKAAKRNGWYEDITKHMKVNITWKSLTFQECKEISMKCQYINELKKKYGKHYSAMKKNGWYNELTRCIKIQLDENIWTLEKCKKEALKYNSVNSLILKNKKLVIYLKQKQWYNIIKNLIGVKDVKPNGYWTYEKCKEATLECKSYSEFFKKYKQAAKNINENNWLELISHLPKKQQKPNGYWTYEKCKEVAQLCNGRYDMKLKYKGAYESSTKNKWLDVFYPKK